MRCLYILTFVCFLIFPSYVWAKDIDCKTIDAIYSPHPDYSPKISKTHKLRFELDIVEDEFTNYRFRGPFFIFTAFDAENGEKLSDMILGSTDSFGYHLSAEIGQYYKRQMNMDYGQSDYKSIAEKYSGKTAELSSDAPSFDPLALGNNMEDLTYKFYDITPNLFIFPKTGFHISRNASRNEQDWDHYIRFYNEERLFPDFGGLDVWVFDHCQ